MEQVAKDWADRFEFHVVSGGMITGERQGVIAPQMAEYILNTVPRLEKMTGVKFGEVFLKSLRDGTYYASSVKPSRAMAVFREIQPENATAFAHAMQKELFLKGNSLEEDATYRSLCKDFGIDAEAFLKDLDTPTSLASAQEDFALSSRLGVSGYPAVLGIRDGKAVALTNGYSDTGTLTRKLKQFLER